MNTKQFVLWLNGYLDACGSELTEPQTEKIKNKLNDLFQHEAEPKITLEELGEKHGFDVVTDVTTKQFNESGGDKTIYRC